MDEQSESSESKPEPRRRLHPSTLVACLLTSLALILLLFPGRIDRQWDVYTSKDTLKPVIPRFSDRVDLLHGWPLTFLARDPFPETTPPSAGISYWGLTTNVRWFRLDALLADIVLLVALLWVTGWLFENWRRRRNHILQLHVIDVLLIAVVVAVGSGVLAYQYSVLRLEQRALARVNAYQPKSVNWGNRTFDRARWQPSRFAWIKQLYEHEYVSVFDRIVGFEVGGEELPLLSELKHLRFVNVRGTASNEQLHTLSKLPELEVLDLTVSQLKGSDDALQLPPLPNLAALNFGGSAAYRGDGLEHLQAVTTLDLTGTAIDDGGLAKLAGLKNLKHLYLDATMVTNDGLVVLQQCPAIERLSIRFVEIDEVGLAHLAALPNLELLYLYRVDPLSDEEQAIVASMPRLRNPDLGLAPDEELRDLRRAFDSDIKRIFDNQEIR